MKKKQSFSMIEMMVVIAVILLLMALVGPVIQRLMTEGKKAQAASAARDLVAMIKMYGEGNKKGRLPYPITAPGATGKGQSGSVAWGEGTAILPAGINESTELVDSCLSTHVVRLLLRTGYIKPNETSVLTVNARSGEYVPLLLGADKEKLDADQTPRWNAEQELDFQVYASKFLTTSANAQKVMVISYDNQYLPDCHFGGEGWIVGFLGGEAGFRKNAWYGKYDTESGDKTLMDVTSDTEVGKILAEAIKVEKSAKSFKDRIGGVGGGSTELVGLDSTNGVFKTLIND